MRRTAKTIGLASLAPALLGLVAGLVGAALMLKWHDQANGSASRSAPPVMATTSQAVDTLAAMRELQSWSRHERERERELEAADDDVPSTAHDKSQPVDAQPDQPESLEEAKEQQIADHERAIVAHDRESRDSRWASTVEANFMEDIREMTDLGAESKKVDCRTTTCTLELEWGNYDAAVANYAKVLTGRYRTNCGKRILLPEPANAAQPYRATVVFDCNQGGPGESG